MANWTLSTQRRLGLLLVLLCAGCATGQDAGRPARQPVTGTVTLNGTPLAGATVIFSPADHHHAAVGVSDTQGRFKLRTFGNDDGAVPGAFAVTIHKQETTEGSIVLNDDDPVQALPRKQLVPVNYTDAKTSGLSAIVEADKSNEFRFELTGKLSGAPMSAPH